MSDIKCLCVTIVSYIGWRWYGWWRYSRSPQQTSTNSTQQQQQQKNIVDVFTKQRLHMCVFGDSITQYSIHGWCGVFHQLHSREIDIQIRGYSGYNTRWALQVLHEQIKCHTWGFPHVVTVFFGANDAAQLPSVQHVPIREYGENLCEIVALLRQQRCELPKSLYGVCDDGSVVTPPTIRSTIHGPIIILITPPPVDEVARGDSIRMNDVTKEYAMTCEQVGVELGVPVLNLWKQLQQDDEWRSYLCDGLHLSQSGNERVAELLDELFTSVVPPLAMDYPGWKQFAEFSSIRL